MSNVVSLCEYRKKLEDVKRENELREIEELTMFVDAWIEYLEEPKCVIFNTATENQDYSS